jgi:hypothetical protein
MAIAGSINDTSGLLTAETDLDGDSDLWVFAVSEKGENDSTITSNAYKVTVKAYVPPPNNMAIIVRGNAGSAVYDPSQGGLVIKGNGTFDTSNFLATVVYVKAPTTKGAFFGAEVDIDLTKSSFGVAHNNSIMGIMALQGAPSRATLGVTGGQNGWMTFIRNSKTSLMNYANFDPFLANRNDTGNAIGAAATKLTLGINAHATNNQRANHTMKDDLTTATNYDHGSNRFTMNADDDVYIALIVSSNGSGAVAQTTMVVTEVRIRTASGGAYEPVDLRGTVEVIP